MQTVLLMTSRDVAESALRITLGDQLTCRGGTRTPNVYFWHERISHRFSPPCVL
ncbi:MAG TPA: hypothetical protein VEF89_23210 [Solirubrobacteraceae bacterium]|nr:hypothetical protein [Solirubrobacteraceae bacterium]